MTFEQADRLMWRILDFLLSMGGNYTEARIPDLQEILMLALATRQFVIKIDAAGEIQYFACWWFCEDDEVDDVLDFKNRTMPEDITTGRNSYVAEVASRGNAREMIKRIEKAIKRPEGRSFWHKPHRNGLVLSKVKRARL